MEPATFATLSLPRMPLHWQFDRVERRVNVGPRIDARFPNFDHRFAIDRGNVIGGERTTRVAYISLART